MTDGDDDDDDDDDDNGDSYFYTESIKVYLVTFS